MQKLLINQMAQAMKKIAERQVSKKEDPDAVALSMLVSYNGKTQEIEVLVNMEKTDIEFPKAGLQLFETSLMTELNKLEKNEEIDYINTLHIFLDFSGENEIALKCSYYVKGNSIEREHMHQLL